MMGNDREVSRIHGLHSSLLSGEKHMWENVLGTGHQYTSLPSENSYFVCLTVYSCIQEH